MTGRQRVSKRRGAAQVVVENVNIPGSRRALGS
jgi:hypothetical protein